jgi:hypothetical protein
MWPQLYMDFCVALAAGACIVFAVTTAEPKPLSLQVEEKAVTLFRSWLSFDQARQYDSQKHFDVIGSDTGTRYRIRYGVMMNIDQL